MSIHFPKTCRTKAQKSEHARWMANQRWTREREGRAPVESCIGYLEFGGRLAAGQPMRLELWQQEGKRKWEGRTDGRSLGNMSERTVLALVRTVLRAPR